MAVLKDATAGYTLAVDSHGAILVRMVDASGAASSLTIGGSVEVANDVGNPLPISGSVTIGNFPGTQPVSGTFWQATQPVSIAAMPALVAGTATIGKVDQGAAGASAWPVTLAALPALPAGTNTIGKVDQGAPNATPWNVTLTNATVEVSNDSGNPLPVSGTVQVNQGTAGAASWLVAASQSGAWSITANAGTGTFNVGGAVSADVRQGGSNTSAANPLPVQLSQGNTPIAANNPLFTQDSYGNAPVSQSNPYPVMQSPVGVVSAVGTANTALTVTLPAAGAGLYHYITGISIGRANGNGTIAVGTVPLNITSTNLPGAFQLRYGAAAIAAGQADNQINMQMAAPLKASAPNTATTLVLPAPGGATAYWMVNVFYLTAP